ncbi:AAA family ATPase [Bradyrhizobium sp. IC3195]|uniref:AAA family ATPase n=1 Tax=Bradyrhizobium sp. IC3195 TaxID=2793804 RepID=UPI001CD2B163|nr:adenylate/guanylate cyclase domain-containing protein [Bradyrhizobium sp. IC3195]MCA1469252.1 AAA family ATPase [Bradyrhizobium sp. IC3195]
MRCKKCGATSPQPKRFCADCGASLSVSALSGLSPPDIFRRPTERVRRERRHLTVLFADLVNSTRLASERDPEEWRDIVTECLEAAGDAIGSFGGYVARYMGDGVLAYFGWPTASEDDAERAVRAGLAIIESMGPLNRQLAGKTSTELAVRVGIHSGWVVIDELGTNKVEVFGDTPNIASRVQAKCAPNSILMTAAVHDLVARKFVVEDHGSCPLAGIARPIHLYRAVAPSGIRRTWRQGRVRGPSSFVNRKREFEALRSSWTCARNGAGRYVLLTGEPGIGKSRLVEEFRASIKDAHIWMECAGERFAESTPFHSVTGLLAQAFDGAEQQSDQDQLRQLERAIRFNGLDPAAMMPLIAEMLNLSPAQDTPEQLAPEEARGRLMVGLAEWILQIAKRQPLILVVEDLHWVDPSSIELIGMLMERSANIPLLLIATARTGYGPPWQLRKTDKSIVLGRLSDDEIGQMIAGSPNVGLTEDVVARIVRRSDGIPIFAEELLSFLLDGERDLTPNDIPATLLDSLTARLDRLGPARRVAQVAAVIGRDFDYALLRAVMPGSDHFVQAALDALVRSDVIYTQGKPPRATFQFRHALIRDAAYEGLLKSERRELHSAVARTVAEQFPALAAAQPALLARHWSEAAEVELAIATWKNAGQAALARCAFKEAEEAFRQASALLERLSPSEERDRVDLDLCSLLVRVLQVTKGYSAPETMELGARARTLAERLGDVAQLVRQGARTWASIFFTGDYTTAASLAQDILDIALTEGPHSQHLFFAHYAQVQARFYSGDIAGVEEYFAKLSPLLDTKSISAASYLIIPIGVASRAAWQAGRLDVARERMSRAMTLAKKSGDPYAMAMALHFKGNFYWCLKAPRRVEIVAERLFAVSQQHGLGYASDLARILLGWSRSQLGRNAEGVDLINEALAGFASSGAKVAITYFLTLLSEAHARSGNFAKALETVEDALVANLQELIWRPYTLTWRGHLRLETGQPGMAEADFRNALELARSLGHKAWQLRAATGLARLLSLGGDHSAALETLRPIYSTLRETFQTPDLREAKSLISEVSRLAASVKA